MPSRLPGVRHGATQLTAEDRFPGDIGVDLSDDGRWQAARLGERLREHHVDAIYCSPFSRTRETASLTAERLGEGPGADAIAGRHGLREISQGRWEGLTRRDADARHADG